MREYGREEKEEDETKGKEKMKRARRTVKEKMKSVPRTAKAKERWRTIEEKMMVV